MKSGDNLQFANKQTHNMTTPNTNTALVPKEDKAVVEFKPFGSEDAIKLTVSIVKNLIAIPTKSGRLPSDNECMKFMMLCRSRALNPFEGDSFLQGYDGKDGPQFSLITAHQAFLKRAEVHPEFDGFESGVIVADKDGNMVDRIGDFTLKDDELLGGWCTVHFKGRKHPMKKRLKLSTFNQGFGRWQKDAAGMIVKCAEADALRSSFPTKIGGMYLREECDFVQEEESRFKTARPARVSSTATVTVDSAPAPTPQKTVDDPDDTDLGPQNATDKAPQNQTANPTPDPKATKAAEKQADKPESTRPTGDESKADPGQLFDKIKGASIPEHEFCLWLSNRYKLSPMETVDELNEIAPNRVKNANLNFDKLRGEFQAANANN